MESPETVRSLLEIGAADAVALSDVDGRTLNYGELRAQVDRLAAQLVSCGVGPTDTVAALLPNGPEMAVAFLAVTSCAAIAPLNRAYRAEELRFYFGDLAPRVLITTAEAGVAARAVLPETTIALDLMGGLGQLELLGEGLGASTDAAIERPDADDVVAQAVTFGRPHDRLGEDVAAAVVLAEGQVVDEATLRSFSGERLAPFKVPRTILFIDEIPKDPTGKVPRIGLADQLGLT